MPTTQPKTDETNERRLIDRTETVDPPTPADEPAISVTSVSKTYGDSDPVTAVDDVSLEIDQGSVVGVLGPNGAGKTTLLKSILGVVIPDTGEIELFGRSTRELGRERYQYVSAMLEGARNIYWRMSLRENVRYFTGLQGIDPSAVGGANTELISRLGMAEKLDEPVRNFSRGQKQRASLACVLAQRTPITFLDEPTLGLDVQAAETLEQELVDLTASNDRTVVLSSHNMDVVERLCDRVIVLQNGSVIASGTVASLVALFESQTYDLRLSEQPDQTARRELEEAFESVSWRGNGGQRLTVTVAAPERLYDLMDELRSADIVVEGIESGDDDLEAAFLRVTESVDTPREVSHAR
jgi:ABC-2 type transport system ATP-binding protein